VLKMIRSFVALIILVLVGCDNTPHSEASSGSAEQAEKRGILIAQYEVPSSATLDRYKVRQVWIERHSSSGENRLVVRLEGPHVDTEPRVTVGGLDYYEHYRSIWSERGGPPYEVWLAPISLVDPLVLSRDGKALELPLKSNQAQSGPRE
jgi:hypothetical protein